MKHDNRALTRTVSNAPVRFSLPTLTPEQLQLLKTTICRNSTDDELSLFLVTASRLRLDPFARQIYAVKRWDSELSREVMAIQVGVDGYRLLAERTGEYEGQTPPQWCGPEGEWVDVWLSDAPPSAARITIHRRGRIPVTAVALFSAYAQRRKNGELVATWKTSPAAQLAKCAETLAFRRLFPVDTFAGAATDPAPELAAPAVRGAERAKASEAQLYELSELALDARLPEAAQRYISGVIVKGLTEQSAAAIIRRTRETLATAPSSIHGPPASRDRGGDAAVEGPPEADPAIYEEER